MLMVRLGPTGDQFTPSGELKPLSVLPLRATFTQNGKLKLPELVWLVWPPVAVR